MITLALVLGIFFNGALLEWIDVMEEYQEVGYHAVAYCQPLQYRTSDCKVMSQLIMRANTVASIVTRSADGMVNQTEVIRTLTKNIRSKLAIAQQRGNNGELYSLP